MEQKEKLPTTSTAAIEEYDKRIKQLKKDQAMDQLIGALGKGAGAAAGLALDMPINVDTKDSDFSQQFRAQKERLNALLDTLKEKKRDVEKRQKESEKATKESERKQEKAQRESEKEIKFQTAKRTKEEEGLLNAIESAWTDKGMVEASKEYLNNRGISGEVADVAGKAFTKDGLLSDVQDKPYIKFIDDYYRASPKRRQQLRHFMSILSNPKNEGYDKVIQLLRDSYGYEND